MVVDVAENEIFSETLRCGSWVTNLVKRVQADSSCFTPLRRQRKLSIYLKRPQ